MSIPELFIRRPVATTLVMLGILFFGLVGYRSLPVSDLPNVDYPTLQVQASLPGANPDTMGAAVALPLEKQFSTIAGLDSMVSQNTLGNTRITLQFNLQRSLDGAAQDVQNAISQAGRLLPQNMPAPPAIRKVNPADQPVLQLAMSSSTLPLSAVDEYAETLIAQSISTVKGVAQVQVWGAAKFAVHVQLDPHELATRQIGIDDVNSALNDGNVNIPAGVLWGPQRTVTLQATGQLFKAADYGQLIVAYRNGSPVRLADLGRVIDSVENPYNASWYYDANSPKGVRAIQMAISKQPGTNVVEVVDGVKAMLPALQAQLPPAITLYTLYDRSLTIRHSVDDVKFTLELALFLVVLVIFLFLRNLSATVIPSLALPLSLVGTFAVMYLCGYSMDNLSLMALTLSVGFVVDDAIVVLENIVRHIESGVTVFQAAVIGANEIGFTILSMTLSLAAVFIPVLFMGGVLGRLLNEFAVTIMSAILVSGFVSLTLTPMLCSRFLKHHHNAQHGRIYALSERVFEAWLAIYRASLARVMRHRRLTIAAFFAIVVGTALLFVYMPKGFLPSDDVGQVFVITEAAQDVSFDAMANMQRQVSQVVRENPHVKDIMAFVGSGGPTQSLNNGRIFVTLQPREDRPSADSIVQELRPTLMRVPGIRAFVQNIPAIRIGQLTKSAYQ